MCSLIVARIAYIVHRNGVSYSHQAIGGWAAMDTVTAVRDRILELCELRGISINKLATLSAVPPSSVKNILYGKSQNPKLLTIKLLCDGLGITLGEFFSAPVFDQLEQEIK